MDIKEKICIYKGGKRKPCEMFSCCCLKSMKQCSSNCKCGNGCGNVCNKNIHQVLFSTEILNINDEMNIEKEKEKEKNTSICCLLAKWGKPNKQ